MTSTAQLLPRICGNVGPIATCIPANAALGGVIPGVTTAAAGPNGITVGGPNIGTAAATRPSTQLTRQSGIVAATGVPGRGTLTVSRSGGGATTGVLIATFSSITSGSATTRPTTTAAQATENAAVRGGFGGLAAGAAIGGLLAGLL